MLHSLLQTDPDAFWQNPILNGFWYYAVEVTKDRFTPGLAFPNMAISRDLLRRASVAGARAYDFGTMEGLTPTLLAKRGARKVVAIDAIDYSQKISLVRDLHGVNYDYHPNIQLDYAPTFFRNKARMDGEYLDRYDFRADLTVIGGMLYHVFSPIHLLGYARSVTRLGGLVMVETAALRRDTFEMMYNYVGAGRYIYDYTDTWFPSLPLLDYMIRMCKLRPIDMLWTPQVQYPDLVRVAVMCRATEDVLPFEGERLMQQSTINLDHNIFVDTFGERKDLPPLGFEVDSEDLVLRPDGESCDIYQTALSRKGFEAQPDQMRLRLDAMA